MSRIGPKQREKSSAVAGIESLPTSEVFFETLNSEIKKVCRSAKSSHWNFTLRICNVCVMQPLPLATALTTTRGLPFILQVRRRLGPRRIFSQGSLEAIAERPED